MPGAPEDGEDGVEERNRSWVLPVSALTNEDLHAAAEAQHQVKGRLLLDIVVRQGAVVLEMLAGEGPQDVPTTRCVEVSVLEAHPGPFPINFWSA